MSDLDFVSSFSSLLLWLCVIVINWKILRTRFWFQRSWEG